jgi:hypothetical protein
VALEYSIAAQESDNAINDPEAFAVYAILLPKDSMVRNAPSKSVIVVQRETEAFSPDMDKCASIFKSVDAGWLPVADNFKTENAKVRFVLPGRPLGRDYGTLPKSQLEGDLSASYVQVSAVGFNASKTRAMVIMAHRCPSGRCNGGGLYFLEKAGGSWVEFQAGCRWGH